MLSEIFGFPKYPIFLYSFSNFSEAEHGYIDKVTAVGGDPFLTSMIMGPGKVFPGKAPTIFGDLFLGAYLILRHGGS